MFGAIFSFLGGSVFRAIWGEVSAWMTARQDHEFELARLKAQGDLDAATHARNMEAIRVQAELGVKTIQVQADADVGKLEMEGWAAAVAQANKATGIFFVDVWNGSIRPLAASISIFLWVVALNAQGFKMGEWDRELVGVILGFFFASRVMSSKGK
jgi:hypothetical protein